MIGSMKNRGCCCCRSMVAAIEWRRCDATIPRPSLSIGRGSCTASVPSMSVLGEFIDWHIQHDNLPRNIEAIEAAYRRWIRREARFVQQSRHRPQEHGNVAEAESEAAVEAVRRLRAMRANGAGQ